MSVNQSYAFREQCEQADTTLRQYAQRVNEANEEASTVRINFQSIFFWSRLLEQLQI